MGVLMRVVDRVVVLDHGEKIFDGAPSAAQSDARVIEVYLGEDAGLIIAASSMASTRATAVSRRLFGILMSRPARPWP